MSENRAFFRDTVERILADTLTQADIMAAEERVLPAALYAALAENGITMMLVPEDKGGIGASIADALVILRAAGEAAAPGPLLETMLGQALLAEAGCDPFAGTIALAFVDADATTAHDVPWGGVADHLLRIAPDRLTLVTGATSVPGIDTAGEPRDTLTGGITAFTAPIDGAAAFRHAAILRAGQLLGAIDWTLRRSIDYSGERKQFGREISKFQVIQQMLAELADHALAASGITEAAAEVPGETLVAAARARIGDAADAAITIGHQVHGAIGFSREYALNLRTRRLMAWRDDFGSVLHWRRTLASAFVGCSRESFWPSVADAGLQRRA